jgi:exopolysaccharide biosynthesis polyprenyl glycosylphosphotransferase
MHSERVNLSKEVGLVIDSLLMIASFFICYYVRKPFVSPPFEPLAPLSYYLWTLAVSLPFTWVSLLFMGVYSTRPTIRPTFWPLFGRFCLVMFLVLSLLYFLFSMRVLNRTLAIPFAFLSALFFTWWRLLLSRWQRSRGISRRALLIGEGPKFSTMVQELKNEPLKDFEPIGVLSDSITRNQTIEGLPVLGNLADLYNILRENVVDEVIFAVPLSEMERYRSPMTVCETVGVSVLILMDNQWPSFSRVDVGKVLNRPFVYLASTPVSEVGSWTKEVFDRCFASAVLLATAPVFLLIALLVKLTSKGPVFFIQERTGLYGRKFQMYKFRTMIADAAAQKALLQSINEMQGPVFKIKNDPRVTSVGRILRKYSLDELPQFLNVLKGDMSLVGPRPLPCEEAALIQGAQRRRFSVKPGLTCIWQISGRNEIDYDSWMALDLQYIDRWSLGLDFQILLKTPAAIISSKGAF